MIEHVAKCDRCQTEKRLGPNTNATIPIPEDWTSLTAIDSRVTGQRLLCRDCSSQFWTFMSNARRRLMGTGH